MKLPKFFVFAFFILLIAGFAHAATITGTVTDKASGDPLPGANVSIKGTSLGAAADLKGKYVIAKIPPGTYTLIIRYIGYQQVEYTVIVGFERTVTQDAKLEFSVLEGELVTVSAQAQGQLAAINQQLAADAMMNVVDGARIQELPDQNAAEAIARLPGITISRNDGEGSGVGIRGLAPRYNQVQIDGVVMGSSPNIGRAEEFEYSQDRSVSLSSMSQENLSGIEVYKAILPDMDAATLGGTINLRLGKAPTENVYEARVYGAYNSYEDDWGNYKVAGKTTRRFFDKKFGVQLSLDAERRNRGNDRLSGGIVREDIFQADGSRITQYRTDGATIRNLRVIREKQGVNAIFDFVTPGGRTEILFSNFYNHGTMTSREIRRNNDNLYGVRTDGNTYSLSNALRATHHISNFEIDWQLSHYKTETDTPDDYQIWFAMRGEDASVLNAADKIKITPEEYLQLLPDNGTWGFNQTYKDIGRVAETKYAAKLDIKYPFFVNNVSGFFKTGVLLKKVDRLNRLQQRSLFNGRFPNGAEGPNYADYSTDYNADPVLNDKVTIRHYINVDKIKSVWTDWIKDYEYSAYNPLKTANRNYDLTENFYAGYLMMKIGAFNDLLTFIPGVRYEGNNFDATGYYHYIQNASTITYNGIYEKRNAKRDNGFWLPMVHLKVKPVDWFDARLAVTKTISRPNYLYLIPNVTVSFDDNHTTESGNPDIKTTESWNFDLSTSFYSSKFGLLTIAGFHKEIKNFSYELTYFVKNAEDAILYGLDPNEPAFAAKDYFAKNLDVPVNTNGISTVKGFEIDYQANFLSLPGLLKNITFNINYTRTFSESWLRQYAVTLDSISYIRTPPYIVEHKTFNVGFREGRLPTQPDHILNVAIGYDIGRFSGRFSTFFQGRSLSGVGFIEKADTYVGDFLRYDMSLRYRLTDNLSFLLTGVNLSSTPDKSTLSGTSKYSAYAVYGTMYDFGIQYTF